MITRINAERINRQGIEQTSIPKPMEWVEHRKLMSTRRWVQRAPSMLKWRDPHWQEAVKSRYTEEALCASKRPVRITIGGDACVVVNEDGVWQRVYSDDGKHWYIVYVGPRCLYRVCAIFLRWTYTRSWTRYHGPSPSTRFVLSR